MQSLKVYHNRGAIMFPASFNSNIHQFLSHFMTQPKLKVKVKIKVVKGKAVKVRVMVKVISNRFVFSVSWFSNGKYHHLTVNHDESNFKDQVKLQIYISQDPKLQFPVEVFKADTQIARIEEILDRLQAKSGKRIDSSIADANVVPKVNASNSSRSKLDQEDDYKKDVFADEMERQCLYAISKYLSAAFEG